MEGASRFEGGKGHPGVTSGEMCVEMAPKSSFIKVTKAQEGD